MSGIYKTSTFKVLVASFYLLSLLLIGVLQEHGWLLQIATHVLAFLAGCAIVFLTREGNVWILFTIGWIQPLLKLPYAYLNLHDTGFLAIAMRTASTGVCLLLGLVVVAGGAIPMAFGIAREECFSFEAWIQWIKPSLPGPEVKGILDLLQSLAVVGGLIGTIFLLLAGRYV